MTEKKDSRIERLHNFMHKVPHGLFSLLCLAAILWLTLAPHPLGENEIELFDGADKVVHGIMFFGLTLCMLFDLQRMRQWRRLTLPLIAVVTFVSMGIGTGIEYLQVALDGGRQWEFLDIVADTFGSVAGAAIWMFVGGSLGLTRNELVAPVSHDGEKPRRKIPRLLKVTLKVLMWIVIAVILIPVAIYIPPVQTALKNLASTVVKKSTGMEIGIDRFRLKFPLDVSLEGVKVVEASGDTMVRAREVVADVRLLPLLHLDVKVKRLMLKDGYYRMVSPDSSMIMKIKAGFVEVDSRSSVNISESDINLNMALMRDADVSLYMNVWKQKPTPPDTSSTPFLIKINELRGERIRFAMSMLPTIDTLTLNASKLDLRGGVINLRTNDINARLLAIDGGDARYIAPTPEYVKTHPAPVADSGVETSAPMTITADSVGLHNFAALYATRGVKPSAGFDPGYISVKDVNIGLRNFYNQAASLRLPIVELSARERCGLVITSGHGLISLSESGISIDGMEIRTPYSNVSATVDVPFALMELKPEASVNARLRAGIGMPDVLSFMPDLGKYISKLPSKPINALLVATGSLDNVKVEALDVAVPTVFSLRASGNARNALDYKRLIADLVLEGEVENPAPVMKLAGKLPVDIPPFRLKGKFAAAAMEYKADIDLVTPQGSLLAAGQVGLNSERYNVDLDVNRLNVSHFMPDLGIGNVNAGFHASGAGFNPVQPSAHSDITLDLRNIVYKGKSLDNITLDATLAENNFTVVVDSPNSDLNLEANLSGYMRSDDYCLQGFVKAYKVDLKALGFSTDENYGSANLRLDVSAQPEKWLYDANIDCSSIEWYLPEHEIYIPDGFKAVFVAEENNVHCSLDALGADVAFDSRKGLKEVTENFSKAVDVAIRQMKERNLDIEELQAMMPDFRLRANVSGQGILRNILQPYGMSMDTIAASLSNDTIIHGNIYALGLNTGGLDIDTINLNLKERRKLIDYKLHIGNRPGTLDEFADVNINGYAGSNRLSAFLTQHNVKGEMGYRFGFTAAAADSTVSVHFTPLRATIAYLPWNFNDDNHVDYCFSDGRVDANLKASSAESSILLKTEPSALGGDDLHLNIDNIKIQDFLRMSALAPPVEATVDGDVRVHYDGKVLNGKGDISVENLYYEHMRVGDFNLGLNAGVDLKGQSNIVADLKIDGRPAAQLTTLLEQKEGALAPSEIDLALTKFPLKVANAFLGADMANLSGSLNGEMKVSGNITSPMLNGYISCDSVSVFLPIMGSSLRFGPEAITVKDNILDFNNFEIFGANQNPLRIAGSVDARKFTDLAFDINANASNFQLMNNDRRARSDIYGKLFMNLTASVKGPMKHFDVNANLNILGNSDVYYTIPTTTATRLSTASSRDDVVTFVNFNDTVATQKADTVPSAMAMRINASLNITPGTKVTVNLSGNGTDKVQISPSGSLNYYQNYMGDMSLNGQLNLGSGLARYKVQVIGEKSFDINPSSYVAFSGNMMNPTLNIIAVDDTKASVVNSSGNTSLVVFQITLKVTGTLSNPNVVFDLSTDDDITLQNELQSMTPDQRSTQAMNLLITGRYQGSALKTSGGNVADNMLYSLVTSQINQWAAQNIRGVDLSFGAGAYDKSINGENSTTMSYSYQVSKSLFDNKFKIVVGGNYSTDATADENFTENLISDISFEYTLKQTNSLTMLVRLFRHMGFESILEGEVTETGVGFTMRRRLNTLRNIFKVRWGKRKSSHTDAAAPSVPSGVTSDADTTVAPVAAKMSAAETDTMSVSEKSERK